MVHYCVVPGCHNSSSVHRHLSFHRLPLKNKSLLKNWIHKIGRKNLPLNGNSRVCSEHFETDRLLGKNDYPTKKLPVRPLAVAPFRPRNPPKARLIMQEKSRVPESQAVDQESGLEEYDMPRGVNVITNTDLSGTDIEEMEHRISDLTKENSVLRSKISSSKFTIGNIATCDKKVSFYTGFPSYGSLKACFDFLGPSVHRLSYWSTGTTPDVKGKGRPRGLSPIDEFFMVLVRLRLGSLEQDLSDRFDISCSTVSRIFTTWINFLYLKLKEIPLWPPQEVIQGSMPKSFSGMYPNTRVVIDATEIYVEKPSLPDIQQMTFSNYKNSNTFKVLVGISPSGAIIFISDLYPGSISDKELTRKSGILELLQRGDSVMADRGFDIQDDLTPLGVKLNMPPFLRGKSQLDYKEMVETRRIASVRIHVERAMERIKNYHIFDKVLSASLTDLANQIFFVCAVLSNFWPPLCQ